MWPHDHSRPYHLSRFAENLPALRHKSLLSSPYLIFSPRILNMATIYFLFPTRINFFGTASEHLQRGVRKHTIRMYIVNGSSRSLSALFFTTNSHNHSKTFRIFVHEKWLLMRKYVLAIILFLAMMPIGSATKRALLVGISDYPVYRNASK